MTAHPMDIVGYTFVADLYCPDCMPKTLRAFHAVPGVGPSSLPAGIAPTTELTLDAYADILGIDRYDETSFDSSEFPKVVFRDQLAEFAHRLAGDDCGACGKVLGE